MLKVTARYDEHRTNIFVSNIIFEMSEQLKSNCNFNSEYCKYKKKLQIFFTVKIISNHLSVQISFVQNTSACNFFVINADTTERTWSHSCHEERQCCYFQKHEITYNQMKGWHDLEFAPNNPNNCLDIQDLMMIVMWI